MNKEIMDFLKMNDVKYKEKQKLSEISPIKIGGEADFVVFPDCERKLICLICYFESAKIRHRVVGRMSNLLPPDDQYNGVIIRTDRMRDITFDNHIVTVGCGVSLPSLCRAAANHDLGGLEPLSGIPGSIGGATLGNAGAFGREISSLITSVRVYDKMTGSVDNLCADQCDFSYRHSIFKGGRYVILSVDLLLVPSITSVVRAEIQRYGEIRRQTQPSSPSLGSTFKRVSENLSASRLIDECGQKGTRIGGVEISRKHAGFIINVDNGSAAEYLALANFAKDRVKEKYNIPLVMEVEIL